MDYFTLSNPTWFRKLITQRRDFEAAEAKVRITNKCVEVIKTERQRRKEAGLKVGAVQLALDRANEEKREAKVSQQFVNRKLREFLEWLDYMEKTIRLSLHTVRTSREMAKTIAIRDLDYYTQTALNQDEARLRELHFNVDEKTIALVDADVNIIKAEEKWAREKTVRNFDSIYDISEVHIDCDQLGTVIAELYVLENDWKEFLVSIGGLQYVNDLVGKQRDYYSVAKNKAMENMLLRRKLQISIDTGIQKSIQLVWDWADKITKVWIA
jgi:hypothetical protein